MKFWVLSIILFLAACNKPANFDEKTYTLGSTDKNLFKLSTKGAEGSINFIEGPKKGQTKTSKYALAEGFDKYVYQGEDDEILVIFPNGLAIYQDKEFKYSAGFDTQDNQTNINLDGTYNYISQEIYTSSSSYSSFGTIKVTGKSFQANDMQSIQKMMAHLML
jgi:hypothetical protein